MTVAPFCFRMTAFASLFLLSSLPTFAQTAGRGAASSGRPPVSSSKIAKNAAQSGQPLKMPAIVDGKVDFKLLRIGKYPMLQMEVPVRAVQNGRLLDDPEAIVPNPNWVDKIKVTVTIAFENKRIAKIAKSSADAAKDQFIFYRSSATILTMQKNDLGTVAFYLPGELLKRDNITQHQPYAYVVDIEVDGVQAAPSKHSMSTSLQASTTELEGFLTLADGSVNNTAGMLMNQLQAGPYVPPPKFPVTLLRDNVSRP